MYFIFLLLLIWKFKIFFLSTHKQGLFARGAEYTARDVTPTMESLNITEQNEKPHTLENFSYDHFRWEYLTLKADWLNRIKTSKILFAQWLTNVFLFVFITMFQPLYSPNFLRCLSLTFQECQTETFFFLIFLLVMSDAHLRKY